MSMFHMMYIHICESLLTWNIQRAKMEAGVYKVLAMKEPPPTGHMRPRCQLLFKNGAAGRIHLYVYAIYLHNVYNVVILCMCV